SAFALLVFEDFFDGFRGNRLDVSRVGEFRVGHDGGGIAVDQDDTIALFPERAAGLDAGIVEFAALADDDGAGADDQDRVDVSALGHSTKRSADPWHGRLARGPSVSFRRIAGETPAPRISAVLKSRTTLLIPKAMSTFRKTVLPKVKNCKKIPFVATNISG